MKIVIRCQDHPTYRGLKKPRVDCDGCLFVHRMRGATFSRRIPSYMGFGAEPIYARVGSA